LHNYQGRYKGGRKRLGLVHDSWDNYYDDYIHYFDESNNKLILRSDDGIFKILGGGTFSAQIKVAQD